MTSWTKEKTLQLIEKIRESGIWNIKSHEYRNQNIRNDIYLTIAKDLNVTKKEIEDKWHNVKSQFSRELAKINASKKYGAGIEDSYVPSWYAFASLKFLADQYQPVQYRNTDNETIQVTQGASDELILCDVPPTEMTDGQSLMMTVQQLDDYSDSMEFTVPSPSTSDSFGQGKKRKMDNVISLLNIITKISQNLVERSNRDEFSVFGEYVANEMRHLSGPKYRRILLHTRQKINAILSEAEMQRIEIDEENE